MDIEREQNDKKRDWQIERETERKDKIKIKREIERETIIWKERAEDHQKRERGREIGRLKETVVY